MPQCLRCGGEFHAVKWNATYCSSRCKTAAWRAIRASPGSRIACVPSGEGLATPRETGGAIHSRKGLAGTSRPAIASAVTSNFAF